MTFTVHHASTPCTNPVCGWYPDCAGNLQALSTMAERKLRTIEDHTIDSCCWPTTDELARLEKSAGRKLQ